MAHAAYFVDLVGEARLGLRCADEIQWVKRLTADWPNIRAAFRWACERDDGKAAVLIALQLNPEVSMFWFAEAFEWADEALQRFAGGPEDSATLWGAAAWGSWGLGDMAECVRRAEHAATLSARAACDDHHPEWALYAARLWSGRADEALAVARAVAEQARSVGDAWNESTWHVNASVALMQQARIDEAMEAADAAVVAGESTDVPDSRRGCPVCTGQAHGQRRAEAGSRCLRARASLAAEAQSEWLESMNLSAPSASRWSCSTLTSRSPGHRLPRTLLPQRVHDPALASSRPTHRPAHQARPPSRRRAPDRLATLVTCPSVARKLSTPECGSSSLGDEKLRP